MAIVKTGAGHLPDVLLEIMYEFVSSDRLDLWLQKADEVLPSTVLDENSNHTFQHVEQIIKIMEAHDIELPEFRIIEHCSVKEYHGWGERANIPDFIHKV